MKFVWANAYREYRIRLRNPIFPLWDVLVPVIYLLIFGSSLQGWFGSASAGGSPALDYPTFFLPAVLSMVTFSIAMNSSYTFFEDLQSGIFQELLTYPFPRRDLLLGKLLFNAGFGVVGSALCVAAGVRVLGTRLLPERIPALLLFTVAGMAGWYLTFTLMALKIRSFNGYHTTSSSAYLLLMFVSNLFYPTEQLPRAVQWAAWLNPVTWQVDLLRYLTYGAPGPWLGAEAAAFLAFTALCFWACNRALNSPIE